MKTYNEEIIKGMSKIFFDKTANKFISYKEEEVEILVSQIEMIITMYMDQLIDSIYTKNSDLPEIVIEEIICGAYKVDILDSRIDDAINQTRYIFV